MQEPEDKNYAIFCLKKRVFCLTAISRYSYQAKTPFLSFKYRTFTSIGKNGPFFAENKTTP